MAAAAAHTSTARARETHQNIREPPKYVESATAAAAHPFTGSAAERGSRWEHNGCPSITPLQPLLYSYLPHGIKRWLHLFATQCYTRQHSGHNGYGFAQHLFILYNRVGAHAIVSLSCPFLHHTLVALQHCSTKICCYHTYLNCHKTMAQMILL